MIRFTLTKINMMATITSICFSMIVKKDLKKRREILITAHPMIQGVMGVLVGSANAIPTATELPAWKEAATRKRPTPIRMETLLPYLSRIVVSRDLSEARPIRMDMLVNTIIKTVATTMTQRKV